MYMPDSERAIVKRRIQTFRRALGLEQSELAKMIDVGQPQVSRWEKEQDRNGCFNIYPKSFDKVRDRLISLLEFIIEAPMEEKERRFEHIRPSTGEIERGKIPEDFSPVTVCQWEIMECLRIMCDTSGAAEEKWQRFRESALCLKSNAPWKRSHLLDHTARGDLPLVLYLLAAQRDDLEVHGQKFVEATRELLFSNSREGRADYAGGRVILTSLNSEVVEPEEFSTFYNSDRPETTTFPAWESGTEESHALAMALLREVVSRCREGGEFKPGQLDKLWSAMERFEQWQERRSRKAGEVSESLMRVLRKSESDGEKE